MSGRVKIAWLPEQWIDRDDVARVVADLAATARDDLRIVRACRSCGSDRHGKPQVLVPRGQAPVHMSLSRSAGITIVAVTDAGPIGVDVEAVRPDGEDLVSWVRTESLVKATGHGLTIDPADITGIRWTRDLDAPRGYVAAVTVLTSAAPTIVTTSAAPEA